MKKITENSLIREKSSITGPKSALKTQLKRQEIITKFKKFKENEKSNALESDSMLNMNSPLHAATTTPTRGNYENPAFISQRNALNIGAKQLLDTSTQSFIDNLPSDEEKAKNKADRLGRKADRMDKRAVKKEKRVNKRVDKRDIRNMGNPGTGDSTDPSYAKINPYAPNDKVKAYNAKSERLRNEAGDKRSNLEARSNKVQMKANASQLVADNLKKIRLGNTSGNMFSFKNQSFQKISLIKVGVLIKYSSQKKIGKIQPILDTEK